MKQWKAEEIKGQNYVMLFTPEDQANGKPRKNWINLKQKVYSKKSMRGCEKMALSLSRMSL